MASGSAVMCFDGQESLGGVVALLAGLELKSLLFPLGCGINLNRHVTEELNGFNGACAFRNHSE